MTGRRSSGAVGWTAATASVMGASHRRTGRPNQDAVAVVPIDDPVPGMVAVVADGHGGERYVRSDVGSRLAVDLACAAGSDALARLGPAPRRADVQRELAGRLVDDIVDRWRRAVLEHLAAIPFDAEERERAGAPLDDDPHVAYGCTLVLALLGPSWVGLLQVGDGDATVVGDDGTVTAPVPTDDRLVGGETTSLCLPTVRADARVAVVTEPLPELVVLTSDGYANSFAAADWREQAGADLLAGVRTSGLTTIAERLPGWLEDSATAGGDDVSMALVVRHGPAVAPRAEGVAARPRPQPAAGTARGRRLAAAAVLAAFAAGGALGWVLARDDSAATATTPTPTTAAPAGAPSTTSTSAATTTSIATPDATDAVVVVPIGFGSAEIVSFRPVPGGAAPRVLAVTPAAAVTPPMPAGWALRDGSLRYRSAAPLDVAAVHLDGDLLWVVSADRSTLTPYRAANGRRAADAEPIRRSQDPTASTSPEVSMTPPSAPSTTRTTRP